MPTSTAGELRFERPSLLMRIIKWVLSKRKPVFPPTAEGAREHIANRKLPRDAPLPDKIASKHRAEHWELEGQKIVTLHPSGGAGEWHMLYFHGGGYYQRDGGFNAPSIGNGPGEGQVSYAGNYAAVTNISSSEGADLLPIPPGVDPDDLPDLPGQPSRIEGTIFLNANFADNAVNGEIYNRVLISPIDNTTTVVLDDLTLVVSDIDENGEFFGDVEMSGEVGSDVGDYGGIFGGNGATSVAGIVSVSDHIDDVENEQEYGVFVLTQCGQPNDAAVCDIVAPN